MKKATRWTDNRSTCDRICDWDGHRLMNISFLLHNLKQCSWPESLALSCFFDVLTGERKNVQCHENISCFRSSKLTWTYSCSLGRGKICTIMGRRWGNRLVFPPLAGIVNWHFIQTIQTGLSSNMLFISGIQNTPTLANPFQVFHLFCYLQHSMAWQL